MSAHNIYRVSSKNRILSKVREISEKLEKVWRFLWLFIPDIISIISIVLIIFLSVLFFSLRG